MQAAILLINPKYPHNVGQAVRACATLEAPLLRWTGDRVNEQIMTRLPREERLDAYRDRVDFRWFIPPLNERPVDTMVNWGFTPVCVEVSDQAERLPDFVHPKRAVYVFGPEDGDVPQGIKHACHRFVTIPSDGCVSLSAAVYITLYDRNTKAQRAAATGIALEFSGYRTGPGGRLGDVDYG